MNNILISITTTYYNITSIYMEISMITESVQEVFSAAVHCSVLLHRKIVMASISWCSRIVVALFGPNMYWWKSMYCWTADQYFITLKNKWSPIYKLTTSLKTWHLIAECTNLVKGDRGSTVVKLLCYKSEDRWFDPSWCQWIFHWHKILLIALCSWGRLSL